MAFVLGIEALLTDAKAIQRLRKQRVGLVAHPASVTQNLTHSLDALIQAGVKPHCVFGPQHGARGDKQDNMIESEDYFDPVHKIPVLSLYGKHRRPTAAMLENLDVVIFDLQDLGCRIYTYITTLYYFIEALSGTDTQLFVLDRPNPAGRGIDGTLLEQGQESFVGAVSIPCRYGLTIGELALWMNDQCKTPAELSLVKMQDYPAQGSLDTGWPADQAWVNPSPNASSINMAHCFSGTVLLEGTTLSEGRGTTTPLELIGSPDFPTEQVKAAIESDLGDALAGAGLRTHFFEPTFHKYKGQFCQGLQIHTDRPHFQSHNFKPFALVAYMLKTVRKFRPDLDLWRNHAYEYELDRLPIDVINGGPWIRQWVDDADQDLSDLMTKLSEDADHWRAQAAPYYRYSF